ncbi:MAG: sulfatase-like hydrolase/transferase [Marivibrio sp.]|uniref:sulfatase-like hydrolase/transferase n=1 Tax=Marivibrio sp. TaxID=2039719 RepID=UPI0032EED2F4
MAERRNILVIMADELAREGVGCYGGPALTPAIDRLAARGARFTNAYTPSPICVPARTSFMTGLPVHAHRLWSSAEPWAGDPPGWGHALREAGYETASIGKLHHRGLPGNDHGFTREIEPLHVVDGVGWEKALLRRQHHTAYDPAGLACEVRPAAQDGADDPYSAYDRRVCAASEAWLAANGGRRASDAPWALFVSYLRPHYPLTCPPDYLALYDPERLPPIRFAGEAVEYRHPVVNGLRRYFAYDDHFDAAGRAQARAAYFGLCSFVDALIGRTLKALEAAGALDETLVILCSDHGEMNGHHGFWTKQVMYEESVGIPLIAAGPDLPASATVETPASLTDVAPAIRFAAGLPPSGALFGARPLQDLAAAPADRERPIISEYHDGGAVAGAIMLRAGRWKLVAYPGFPQQLFDLEADPHERCDLGLSAAHAETRARLLALLAERADDPDRIDARAFADQAARIEALGGVEAIINRRGFDHTPAPTGATGATGATG